MCNDGNGLVQPHSGLARQAEQEALWRLKDRSFSQVKRARSGLWHFAPPLEGRDEEALGPIIDHIGRGKLGEEKKQKVDELLDKYPSLKGFY